MPKTKPEMRAERSFAGGRIETKKLAQPDSADKPAGWFSGYGSTFNDPHPTSSWMLASDWMDVIAPGAFKASLAEHKARGSMPAMFYNHDIYGDPIGVWDVVEEDKAGLLTEGRLCLDVPDVAEKYSLMKFGALPAESIGFMPITVTLDEKKKTRTIEEIDLYEISVVTLPGNPGAQISDVQSRGGLFDRENIRDFEKYLRDGGYSSSEAKRLAAGGFKALTTTRDAADVSGLVQSLKKLNETIRAR